MTAPPFHDAVALAELVRSGEASPVEITEATIARIEARDGAVNAVIHRSFDTALAAAASPELPAGPFRGVPMLIKDLWPTTAGDPFHCGVAGMKAAGYRHPTDANIVTAYRKAGFVLLGRTNTPELGLVATTEPTAYGPTRNPWDLTRGAGGSSGGAAAAVAAGMVPAANASDGGGSIRIPAAMCGLVGLKPSRGRISMGPMQDEWGVSVQHVVSHTVRDTAAILDATAYPFPGDGVVAPTTGQPYLEAMAPARLRIGLLDASPRADVDLHPDCAAAVRAAAALLERLGHHVEPSHPAALEDPEIGPHFTLLWGVNCAANLAKLGGLIGRSLTEDDVEPATWLMAERARAADAVAVVSAQGAQHAFRRRLAEWWAGGYDLLLTPTTARPAPPLGELVSTPENPWAGSVGSLPYAVYTSPYNVSGQPAISLPLGRDADGLPLGVQLVAAYGREDLLLGVAAQLEAEVRWWEHLAPLALQ
jgi:amidase